MKVSSIQSNSNYSKNKEMNFIRNNRFQSFAFGSGYKNQFNQISKKNSLITFEKLESLKKLFQA